MPWVTDAGTPGAHTHTESDISDLDHWTEADHDALDHTGLTGVGGGGGPVPYRVQYLAERVTGETGHTDDLFFATAGSLTGTAVDGAGAGTGTWSLTDGHLKLIVNSTGGSGAREPKARAWAITSASAPMTIETHCTINGFSPSSHSPAVMLGFSDGTAAGSNVVNAYSYLGLAGLLEAHGTFNGNTFSGFNDTILTSRWDVWQRVVWVSSNTFQVQVAITTPHTGSLLNWSAGGTGTLSKTMTPTHFWVGAANDSATATWIAWDYIRVYDSDLSV